MKEGSWFVYWDNENIIRLWSSNFTGKEKVYLNDDLIIESKNYRKNNEHHFTDKNSNNYCISIKLIKQMKGEIECLFKKNGETIRSFKTKTKNIQQRVQSLVIFSVLYTAVVLLYTYVFQNIALYLLMTFIILICYAKTRKKLEYSIVES